MKNTGSSSAPDASKVSADSCVVEPAFGLGRFAPFNWERFPHSTAIRLFWGRLVVWLLVLACVGWITLATGLFAFIKYRRGFSDVRYAHMLFLPWKLDDYRRAKGEFLIKEGLAKAEAQEWRAAFDLLRPGLLAVPDHREARLLVARIYLMAGRPDVTRTTLIDGLKYYANQPEYLREVLGYLFGLQADDMVIALAKDLRPRLDPKGPAARMAATSLAYAYFNRERYTEAEAVLAEARLLGTPEARFVMARITWERGRHADAVAQLRELAVQIPQESEGYRTLIHYLGEEKRWAEVRRASLQRQFVLPGESQAYVDYIAACGEEGDEVARTKAEEAFFERFGGDTNALLTLAEQAARAGRVETANRVVTRCHELGRSEADAVLVMLGAYLERRAYREVIERETDPGLAVTKWPERQKLILGGLQAAALYGLKQEAEARPLVRRLCETRLLPAPVLAMLAAHLEKVGQREEACRVLRNAVEIDPLYQPALVLVLRKALADGQLDDSFGWIDRLVGMRKPPSDLLAGLARALNSDLYLYCPGRAATLGKLNEFIAKSATEARRP